MDVDEDEGFAFTAVEPTEPSEVVHTLSGPIKKPSSSWLIFCAEERRRLSQLPEPPSFTFQQMANHLGEKYKSLSSDEMLRLKDLAAQDKERYLNEVSQRTSVDHEVIKVSDTTRGAADLVIPVGRVKKIMKLDDEIKSIAKEALSASTKATEIFLEFLAVRASHVAAQRGSRVVKDSDVIQAIYQHNSLEFLRMDFPKKAPAPPKSTSAAKPKSVPRTKVVVPSTRSKELVAPVMVSTGKASITSFFTAKPSDSIAPSSSSSSMASSGEDELGGPEGDDDIDIDGLLGGSGGVGGGDDGGGGGAEEDAEEQFGGGDVVDPNELVGEDDDVDGMVVEEDEIEEGDDDMIVDTDDGNVQ